MENRFLLLIWSPRARESNRASTFSRLFPTLAFHASFSLFLRAAPAGPTSGPGALRKLQDEAAGDGIGFCQHTDTLSFTELNDLVIAPPTL